MKSHVACVALGAVVACMPSLANAANKPSKAAPQANKTLADEAGSEEVLRALEMAEYRFTPEFKAAYLAWNRSRAVDRIRAAGYTLPDDFLAWVDGDPVVAATIFGSPSAIQRLVMLRSLDIDLGAEAVREKYTQLALAALRDGLVDVETLSNPTYGISLEPRGLLELEIKRYPMEPVDTRAKDRELDLEDHIINFLEDHPVTDEVKVAKKDVAGEATQVTEERTRPLYAYEGWPHPSISVPSTST